MINKKIKEIITKAEKELKKAAYRLPILNKSLPLE